MARSDTFRPGDRVVVEAASRLDGPAVVRFVEPRGTHVEVEPLDLAVYAEARRLRVDKAYVTHTGTSRRMGRKRNRR